MAKVKGVPDLTKLSGTAAENKSPNPAAADVRTLI